MDTIMKESDAGNLNEKEEMYKNIMEELANSHYSLSHVEKQFLLYAERGDCASVKKLIETYKDKQEEFNINCLDPLNRSALIVAIEKENIDLMELLLKSEIQVKDALLHAINEEYVEGVELLLQWEEDNHVEGQPYSWEAVNKASSSFTTDVTPVILAAHKNNYEILKLLMDRGATMPVVHDIRCRCDECIHSSEKDSLRHSQARMNVYKAMTSPSLICLSSRDALLTAFELYWELRRLSKIETEFRPQYNEIREKVQTFASTLLDHVRTSNELEIILNYGPQGQPWEPGERPTLERLKLAIKYKLKVFVAHPNVQQLLAAMWYQGLPGFRRKNMLKQGIDVMRIGLMFWIYSIVYMISPNSTMGRFMKLPFVKFICDSASYSCFLGLLALASQRLEIFVLELFGNEWMRNMAREMMVKERGALPGVIESMIIVYVIGLVWKEARSMYVDGPKEYISDLWNIVDYVSYSLYFIWISLRFASYYIVRRELAEGHDPWYPRDKWARYEPNLISEGAFAAGMIISFLKMVHIFSINPHLGPLQISLGRMIIDIIKFFFIYTLVLFAFGCGLTQLLWFFAESEGEKCYHGGHAPDFEAQDKACTTWRRFANLFEASQSLFWASFGLVDLTAFDLTGIKSYTRFWAMLIFGSYSVINIIVLLNMLIAMMSSSYQIISERSDSEWKYARTRLFISYFESGDTVPPPFNLIPSVKRFERIFSFGRLRKSGSMLKRKETAREKANVRYEIVMQMLVRRYITSEQKKMEDFSVTEDDIAEVRHDVSTLRFELLDVFRKNGFKLPKPASGKDQTETLARRDKIMERRIMKDFQIGLVEGIVRETITTSKTPANIFGKIAQAIKRGDSNRKDWNAIVQESIKDHDPIGRTSLKMARQVQRQSVRRHILQHQGPSLLTMDPNRLVEYNPNLSAVNPIARIAYAKFKMNIIKREYETHLSKVERGEISSLERSDSENSLTATVTTDAVVQQQQQRTIDETNSPDDKKERTSDDSRELSGESSSIRPRPRGSRRRKLLLASTPGTLPCSIEEEPMVVVKSGDKRKPSIAPKPYATIAEEHPPVYYQSTSASSRPPPPRQRTSSTATLIKSSSAIISQQTDETDGISKQSVLPEPVTTKIEKPSETPPVKAKTAVIFQEPDISRYRPGVGKSQISGNVVSGWM